MIDPTLNPYAAPMSLEEAGSTEAADVLLAEPSTRLVATCLDGALMLPSALLFAMGLQLTVFMGVLSFIGLLIYQLVLLSRQGQTLGKKWMGVKVVSIDGTKAGFAKAVLLRGFVNGLLGMIPLYSLIDALFIFRADRRCIHDLIAGTRVIRAS